MRTSPTGQPGVPVRGHAPTGACALDQDPRPHTVTSHSLTIAAKSFRLDFTWRRVEHDQAEGAALGSGRAMQYDRRARPVPAPAPAPASAPASPTRAARPRQTFAEALRRQQLAGLLLMPSFPPADRQTLSTPASTAEPQAGPVCRAYAQALGPLAAPASLCYSA